MGAPTDRPTVEDHLAIVDLLARYCAHLDRHEVEQWVALFTEDAVYEVYGRTFDGHEGLRRMVTHAPRGLHLGGLPVVEMVGEDSARALHSMLFVPVPDDALRRALYTDELVRTPAGWRFARRRCEFLTDAGLADRPER